MALPSLVVCVCFPLIGFVSDKINKRGYLMLTAVGISCLTQLYIILLPHSDKNMHILFPLVLNQIGYALFITNVWPGLSNFIRGTHPDEFLDADEEEEEDMSRSNISIGIVSSAINIGNLTSPLLIGVILDKSKQINEFGEENFEKGIKNLNLLMCLMDATAFGCLLVWVILRP
jgi:MFS family permease